MATQQAKKQAKQTTQAARRTTRSTKQTTKQAERTMRTLVTDGAYAAVGIGDSAVGALKRVPGQVERLGREAPNSLESGVRSVERRVRTAWSATPEEVKARLDTARKGAEKEFDTYAQRGRAVVQSLQRNQATRRALEQSKTARSQVKAAATSVRKALGQSVEAVETAAEKVGDEHRAG